MNMKRVIVRYSCGYGSHETDFDIEDSATEQEIEEAAQETALERFEWTYRVEDAAE